MRNVVTITTAAAQTKLVTLERVLAELDIDSPSDRQTTLLNAKIDEATSDIEAALGRDLNRATLTETFWAELGGQLTSEYLVLNRAPVASITSVTIDDVAVDATEYRLDADSGILYRLDSTGFPLFWWWCNSVVVVYVAGFLLPGETDRNLPAPLEGAAIDLVTSYWVNRGRDQTIKAEDVPGLGSVQYWVGAVGEAGELPPGVVAKIAPFRRPSV